MSPLAQILVNAVTQLARELPALPILVFGSALADVDLGAEAAGDGAHAPTSSAREAHPPAAPEVGTSPE